MRRLRRAYAAAAALALGLIGCELIVSSTVPDFRCTPGVAGACPENQVCDPSSFQCVTSIGNEASVIDVVPPKDRDTQPGDDDDAEAGLTGAAIGEGCKEKACATGLLCGAVNILTTVIVEASEQICTKTCCNSEDCPTGFVCYGPGTGGNYCVSAARAKRSELGTKKGGAACEDNAECRSGVCADDKHCLDLCCMHDRVDTCAPGTVCRVKSIAAPPPARESWVCAPAESGTNLVAASGCAGNPNACINDNCQGLPAVCRPTCCSNADCAYPGKTLSFCAYGKFTTTSSYQKWCFTDGGPGVGALEGEACGGDNDCAARFCDPDTKKCGRVCCQDKDCATDEVCQPTLSGQPYLRCTKK